MLRILGLCFLLVTWHGAHAQVRLVRAGDRVDVTIDGHPFTAFFTGPDAPKPYLHPLRSASGKVVTRSFPMEQIPGESTSDRHHRGVWLGYKSINGFNFWENESSYLDPKAGKVVTVAEEVRSGPDSGRLRATFDWLAPNGERILEEDRTMVFRGDASTRTIDVEISLKALARATFGDAKDGAFCVRLAEPLIEKNGGSIVNSEGRRRMAETWGKPASWIDYAGTLEGEKLGVALFEHPSSFHHPSRWHVRDYGLLAVNPFGATGFDKQLADASFTLPEGQSIHLRYRILIHQAMTPGEIEKLYREFAAATEPL
jgi:Methane oxygenase PmoA